MSSFLLAAAGIILLTVAVGLGRLLGKSSDADRVMAAQLFGTGGITVLLLFGAASGVAAAIDVALTLALLATFASVAFTLGTGRAARDAADRADAP